MKKALLSLQMLLILAIAMVFFLALLHSVKSASEKAIRELSAKKLNAARSDYYELGGSIIRINGHTTKEGTLRPQK